MQFVPMHACMCLADPQMLAHGSLHTAATIKASSAREAYFRTQAAYCRPFKKACEQKQNSRGKGQRGWGSDYERVTQPGSEWLGV